MNDLIAFTWEKTPSLLADLHGFHSLACLPERKNLSGHCSNSTYVILLANKFSIFLAFLSTET